MDTPSSQPSVDTDTTNTALEAMSKDQLLAYAKTIGVKADFAMKKADIMQAIMDQAETGSSAVPEKPASPPTDPAGEQSDREQTDATPIGTIRFNQGVEMVKVSNIHWVPVIREGLPSDKPVVIISTRRAGKTIYAKTGKPISFDEHGRATVDAEDGVYLKDLPDFSLSGGTE